MILIIVLCAVFDLSVNNASNVFATSSGTSTNNATSTCIQTSSSKHIDNPWPAVLISFIIIVK